MRRWIDVLTLFLSCAAVFGVVLLAYAMTIHRLETTPATSTTVGNPLEYCPIAFQAGKCTTRLTPVMGGIDVAQYLTAYRLINGTYNETAKGIIGSKDLTAKFNGYSFYFATRLNRAVFEFYPSTFLPQYGGFCAWAVAGEVTGFPWSATCLGPYGHPDVWTVINEKVYFFKDVPAKAAFMQNPEGFVEAGDERWRQWFGLREEEYFNTNCTAW